MPTFVHVDGDRELHLITGASIGGTELKPQPLGWLGFALGKCLVVESRRWSRLATGSARNFR